MTYIRMALDEVNSARVPQQLLPNDVEKTENGNEEESDKNIDEYSGVGSIMGYMAPLGVEIDNRTTTSKKKKSK